MCIRDSTGQIPNSMQTDSFPPLTRDTIRLPSTLKRTGQNNEVKDDESYMKGQSAISYDDLAKPEAPTSKSPWPTIIVSILILLAVGGACLLYTSRCV